MAGGVAGMVQMSPFLDTATHLGYPAYFMSILGAWYAAAGIVLLAPRLPRLKEWAYAGSVFNYTGAAASHLWVGDGADKLIAPVIFLGLTAASWALRPPERRDFDFPARAFGRGRPIVFWVATVIGRGRTRGRRCVGPAADRLCPRCRRTPRLSDIPADDHGRLESPWRGRHC